ncbi:MULTISPECIES: 2-hydroxyacid dehydrogenase [unclassified Variovorax]|uniref:2-hydroxyacid dehydrogenase n=1 Tax=unclassified Variovorax TaxID=663243 RepID=UPI00076D97D8|nr:MULTISPECIES: 2-hydroxyacid dehydrogenase [unclassified Variovorax]KWT83573.1 D-3-phosphoglycerate dehydrogenase [Variovorax sp. WDL1]PNG59575.1 2-ketogluconate reductase [Variovorax sp. B4]PNG60634.1 2-ketogluconate reductase [Variovorax sp. B2]VTV13469.1 Glycerate dehydrogenase [Variovorax sp. WDL1]
MSDKIPLLVLNSLSSAHQAQIAAVYDMTYAPTAAERAAAIAAHGARYRAVLTIGVIGLTPDELAAMPKVELICAMGAGYECLPLEAARARGVALANGAGTNDDCVADHAFGLLIGIVRGIRMLDRQCREGVWREAIPQPPNVSGKRLGILGLGTIGQKIAKRAAGFDMEVGYHNRKPREGVAHRYFDSLKALAAWSDVLMIATPGGAGTRHLVDAGILDALGPQGFLVNISRGSVVDTEALAAALREGRIAGAGLDVYESEPKRPEPLIGLDNVLLTPHMAGWSPEATQASVDRFMANAEGHFAGRGVVTPI